MFSPKVISVIVNHDLRGNGKEDNPYRRVTQYLDFDGNLLAEERDPISAASDIKELAATDSQQLKQAIALVRAAGDRCIRPDDPFMTYGLLLTTIEQRACV